MSVDIQGIIMYATFGDDRLRGFGMARDRISHFPIDLRRRPYNTLMHASVWLYYYAYTIIMTEYVTDDWLFNKLIIKLKRWTFLFSDNWLNSFSFTQMQTLYIYMLFSNVVCKLLTVNADD